MNRLVEDRIDPPLALSERFGELLGVGAMLLLFSFLAYHQLVHTGFFTSAFGPAEMFFFYGPIIVSTVALVAKAWSSRRNPARLFEAASNLFLAVGSLWLLIVFPFNYAHLADALPAALRFLLAWITNDIAAVVLTLQVLIGTIVGLVTLVKYFAVRARVHTNRPAHQIS